MNEGKPRKRARRNGRSPKKILDCEGPSTPQPSIDEVDDGPTRIGKIFDLDGLNEVSKVLIDSSVKICCAPHAILFRYNLLEPKTWEDGPIEVTFSNGKKTLSCYYVELGSNLLRVALVSDTYIRNVILSIKQTTERGMELRLTSNRRCVLLRAGSIVADAKIHSDHDIDYVLLDDIEPDLKVPFLQRCSSQHNSSATMLKLPCFSMLVLRGRPRPRLTVDSRGTL
jgi:hypothetical protein